MFAPRRFSSIRAHHELNVHISLPPERSCGKAPLGPSANTLSRPLAVFVVTFVGVFHKPLKNLGQLGCNGGAWVQLVGGAVGSHMV